MSNEMLDSLDLSGLGEMGEMGEWFLGIFAAVLLGICLLFLLFAIAAYVLESIGMYTIAKRRGIHNPWLAWIPIGNAWILGSISDQYRYVAKGEIKNRRKLLIVLQFVALFLSVLQIIVEAVALIFSAEVDPGAAGFLAGSGGIFAMLINLAIAVVSLVMTVYTYIALYDLFHSCNPNNSVLFLTLSIVFTILLPVFVFLCRNKDIGMPPRKQPTVQKPVEPLPQVPVIIDEPSE